MRWSLVVLLLGSVLLSACLGAMVIEPMHLTPAMKAVFLQIRLPRVCLAVLTGAGLAMAGASLQGLFRNVLVDPGLIGISSGASLAAVTVIVFGLKGYFLLNVFTFCGACVSSLVVFRFSRIGGRTVVATLLLAGIGINALCNALTGLITYTANNDQLRSITFWLMGSLGGATWSTVLSLLPFVAIPLFLLPREGRALNAFSLGEAEALHVGVDVGWLKIRVLLLATLAVGATVAVCGMIGFVGLVVPHILRSWLGSDHRSLLVNSALAGAILLTLADLASRLIIAPAELPIGIVTALAGTPVFIFLLYRQKKSWYDTN